MLSRTVSRDECPNRLKSDSRSIIHIARRDRSDVWEFATLCSCLFHLDSASPQYESARYQLIIDRGPFGSDLIETQSETKEDYAAQQLAKIVEQNYRLCMLLENTDGGMRAGLQPTTRKEKSFILSEGENQFQAKLVSVNVAEDKAIM